MAGSLESMRDRLRSPAVDALAGLLDGPRARDAFLLRTVMAPPWCVRVIDEAPLSLVAVVSGSAWVIPDGGEAVPLGVGDVAITRGPQPFTFADDPATAPQAIIHPGQRCTTPDGIELHRAREGGVGGGGNDRGGGDVQLVGTSPLDGEVGGRLLPPLPAVLVVPAGTIGSPLVE